MVKQTQSRVEIFGSKTDKEVQASIEKVKLTGRKVTVKSAPSHDTGQGNCGKLCHCPKGHCASGAYKGDEGAMMGTAY